MDNAVVTGVNRFSRLFHGGNWFESSRGLSSSTSYIDEGYLYANVVPSAAGTIALLAGYMVVSCIHAPTPISTYDTVQIGQKMTQALSSYQAHIRSGARCRITKIVETPALAPNCYMSCRWRLRCITATRGWAGGLAARYRRLCLRRCYSDIGLGRRSSG